MSDNDDRQIGRILRRREVLALLGAAGGATFLARRGMWGALGAPTVTAGLLETTSTALAQAPACVVKPELTEGPYFVDGQLDRSDIRLEPSDGSLRDGVPLTLAFNVSQVGSATCAPLADARIDVWHCDALGVYSGVTDTLAGGGSSVGQKFLRGYQRTDADGLAQFTTIYPGWYTGRAVHIHFKIRTTASTGEAYEFTSQFFLDDALSDQVLALAPYNSKTQRRMRNAQDGIYQSGGSQLVLNAVPSADGYAAAFPIGLDLSDTAVGAADGNTGPGGPGGQRGPGGPGFRPRP
jgi:protocatechuate 3,4-dioxygenase beta subunit